VVILPDAPPIINIGTHVSLYGGRCSRGNAHPVLAVAIRRARSHYSVCIGERDHIRRRAAADNGARLCSAAGGAVMIQFTVDRRLICYHFFV